MNTTRLARLDGSRRGVNGCIRGRRYTSFSEMPQVHGWIALCMTLHHGGIGVCITCTLTSSCSIQYLPCIKISTLKLCLYPSSQSLHLQVLIGELNMPGIHKPLKLGLVFIPELRRLPIKRTRVVWLT